MPSLDYAQGLDLSFVLLPPRRSDKERFNILTRMDNKTSTKSIVYMTSRSNGHKVNCDEVRSDSLDTRQDESRSLQLVQNRCCYQHRNTRFLSSSLLSSHKVVIAQFNRSSVVPYMGARRHGQGDTYPLPRKMLQSVLNTFKH